MQDKNEFMLENLLANVQYLYNANGMPYLSRNQLSYTFCFDGKWQRSQFYWNNFAPIYKDIHMTKGIFCNLILS